MRAYSAESTWAIVNPVAGNGRAGRDWAALEGRLRAAGVALTPRVTRGPGDAADVARRARREGVETLLVAGGDGTLSEVVDGCCGEDGAPGTAPLLALFPLGTGADFARGLGIRRARALDILLHGSARSVDAGRIDYRGGDGAERRRHFINIADFGLGRATALASERGPKALGGTLAYLYGALASIARYRPTPIRLAVDGRAAYDGPGALVGVANGPYFGGGMHAAPKARHDDGLFDIFVVGGVGRRALATDLLPRVYRGAHLRHPAVRFFRGASVALDADGPFPLEADGEGLGDVPARVALLPRALSILVPAG